MSTSALIQNGRRYRLPILTLILALGGLLFVRLSPELEQNFKGWITMVIILFAVLVISLWFVLLSRFPGRVRLTAAVLLGLAFAAFKLLFRVDGSVDGRGLPRFVLKSTPPPDAGLSPPPAVVPAPDGAAVPAPPGAADVPQFFGPNRDGIIRGADLARDWTASPPRLLWRQPIGVGWSAFSVVGGRAFTQEQRGGDELVTCYELATGRLLWSHANHVRFVEWQGGDGPRATPTVAGGRVYAIGATGILDCLDALSGAPLWSRDVLRDNGAANITWGVSGSPLVFDDRVVVTAAEGPSLVAYHKDNGTPLWKAGSDSASYASPILATIAGRRVIVSFNANSLTLHDPAAGAVLLDHPWKPGRYPKAAQPVVLDGDRIFLTAGYGYGCSLIRVRDENGRLTAEELWQNHKMKAQFNSIALRDGFLYGLDDGSLACMDAATGERKWKEGRFGNGQSLLVDDLLLVQGESGAVSLLEARPDGTRELGRIAALGAKTWNHPVLAGRLLLVRNDREAACYELPVKPAAARLRALLRQRQ